MFGFLSPRPHSFEYRQSYARLCAHLRRWYGPAALPFHSFEAVFLYQLALDAGAAPRTVLPNHRCCRLVRRSDPGRAEDGACGRYCASVGVLLASTKLDDDIRDRKSAFAWVVRAVLRGPIARARQHITKLDPRAEETLATLVAEHLALEVAGKPVSIGDYSEPTALAFGHVFGLAARLPGLDGRRELFIEIGRAVGTALIAFDCAVDLPRDRARGDFNPLPDARAAADALAFSADQLTHAAGVCRTAFGPGSMAARTLQSVAARVERRAVGLLSPACTPPSSRQLVLLLASRAWGGLTGGQMAMAGAPGGSGRGPRADEPPPVGSDAGPTDQEGEDAAGGSKARKSSTCDDCMDCGNVGCACAECAACACL